MLRLLPALILALLSWLSAVTPASALSAPKCIKGHWASEQGRAGAEAGASARTHLGIWAASTTVAVESPLASRGGLRPIARSLGAAGDDLLLKKAVNSNLPHAVSRGVERGIFSSADEATAALRGLTEEITKSGTFPAGTLVDTARVGRFLVPIGNGGRAVYQLAKNGTAKLKTVLISR